jgi:penicillin-binding protein 1C
MWRIWYKKFHRKLNDVLNYIGKRVRHKKFVRNFLLLGVSLLVFFIAIFTFWIASLDIPDFTSFEDRKVLGSTKIYDRTGEVVLYDIHQDVQRTNVPFDQMGANIKNATVAIEDSEFYNHKGIRTTSILRATVIAKLTGKKVTGASTITQQLVKNTLLTAEHTFFKKVVRKLKEWVLAVKIDRSMSKEKILEAYLNEIPYGGTIYGIEEASKTYFGKDAVDLTLGEAAYLASIPQSPTILSPYGKNFDRLEARKNLVLSRMKELGFITEEEYTAAKNEKVTFQPQVIGNIKAPHFVFFIKDYLEQKYGADTVRQGGLKVITTLDYNLEEKAEQFVKEGALQNEKDWGGKNASLVAIDPKTGQILSMVGSRNYFDKDIEGNYNVAVASRQPGSSFKPFIYATAFGKGFTPDTVLFDLPTEFQSTCNAYGKAFAGHSQSECYMPDNYDGKFRGPMSLRNALAQSINVPAVQLFYLAGLNDSLGTAENMGISTLTDISRYGLTLVIGGGEVKLLDLTSAYGVFADNGIRNPYTGILRVEDGHGHVLEEFHPESNEVLSKNVALEISDILSDNQARIPTFGANSALNIAGHQVAVKTGTTNNNKDAWTVGYTPSIVVGVWAGNNDNKPMKKGGVSVAGPIWNKFMNEALKTLPREEFEAPNLSYDPATVKPILRGVWQGNQSFFIDKISGKLATEFTPPETREERVVTNVHSILYWVNRKDITGPPPADPSADPQYEHFEIPLQNWWAQNSYRYGVTTQASIPSEPDNIHNGTSTSAISLIEPNSITAYNKDQKINVLISSQGTYPLQKIEVFVNNVYIGNAGAPFTFSFIPSDLDNLQENNTLRVIGYDSAFNRSEASTVFRVTQ